MTEQRVNPSPTSRESFFVQYPHMSHPGNRSPRVWVTFDRFGTPKFYVNEKPKDGEFGQQKRLK